MLQLVQHAKPHLIGQQDRASILAALRDMLSFSGTFIDDQGNFYNGQKSYSDERHNADSCCRRKTVNPIAAEFKPLDNDRVMVTLRSLPESQKNRHRDSCQMLFILAKCDDEWEVMGLPYKAANH